MFPPYFVFLDFLLLYSKETVQFICLLSLMTGDVKTNLISLLKLIYRLFSEYNRTFWCHMSIGEEDISWKEGHPKPLRITYEYLQLFRVFSFSVMEKKV